TQNVVPPVDPTLHRHRQVNEGRASFVLSAAPPRPPRVNVAIRPYPRKPPMIGFSCSGCGKSFSVKDEFSGKKTKCPSCGAPIRVPAASAKELPKVNPVGNGIDIEGAALVEEGAPHKPPDPPPPKKVPRSPVEDEILDVADVLDAAE